MHTFLDGYCSTVQGLLDWFEVDLGYTELSSIQIDLCVLCDFVLYSRVSLSSCPFKDILHCLPRAVGVPLESALNLVSRISPCVAHDTHACWGGSAGCSQKDKRRARGGSRDQNTQIYLNKQSLVNPRSSSNQSSKSCTVLQYPSRKLR